MYERYPYWRYLIFTYVKKGIVFSYLISDFLSKKKDFFYLYLKVLRVGKCKQRTVYKECVYPGANISRFVSVTTGA